MKGAKDIFSGALVVLLILALAYLAILFTGVGDSFVYRNTGYDITGKAKEKYHKEIHEEKEEKIAEANQMPQTDFTVDSAKYNFGEIKEDAIQEHSYTLTNSGENPLVIVDVQVSCGCTVADYTKEAVKPGEKAVVSITFDPQNKIGHVEKSLHVIANVPNTPRALGFVADVVK